jgi:CTP synthase
LNIRNASSKEFGKESDIFVVDWMSQWINRSSTVQECREEGNDMGGTLRLGHYPTVISNTDSIAYQMYQKREIVERHRHRYEVNITYKSCMEGHGMEFTGMSPDGLLPEIVEVRNWYSLETGKMEFHPYFIACQFHPEFQSTPFVPHPLFKGLIFNGLVCDYMRIRNLTI